MRYLCRLLLLVFAFILPARGDNKYKSFFDQLRKEAPEELDIEILKRYPKFRNIYHDSFDRLPKKAMDNADEELQYYTLADNFNIGKNSYQNMDAYAYNSIFVGEAKFAVGVRKCDGLFVACNEVNGKREQLCLLTVNAKTENFGIMVKRGNSEGADVKVAFRILDKYNYYYARLTEDCLLVYRVRNGRFHRLKTYRTHGEKTMYLMLDGQKVYLYGDWKLLGCCKTSANKSSVCGLLFRGNEQSEVDDFVVEKPDCWSNNGMDAIIETGDIKSNLFGSWQTENGLITANSKHTNGSNYSLRFELDYFDKWEPHKIAGSRRTEICPKTAKSAPLDSWISCFDIYFPGLQDDNEYYVKDAQPELFWQSHDSGAAYGLSPHVAIYLQNDHINFETLSRAILRYDKIGVSSNRDYRCDGRIGILVDKKTKANNLLELKRGEWHNFTIFIKEGYTEAQLPRTIVYVDARKVIDWFHPNAYNCGPNAEYLKMGIYKWPWAKDNLKTDVRERVLYFDNIYYFR